MENEPNPENQPNIQDPSGPPEPFEPPKETFSTAGTVGIVVVTLALGIVALPLMMDRRCARGATRSTRLRWEQRQQEIQKVIDAENSQQEHDGNSGKQH